MRDRMEWVMRLAEKGEKSENVQINDGKWKSILLSNLNYLTNNFALQL